MPSTPSAPDSAVAPPRADRGIGVLEVERLRSRLVPEGDVDLSQVAWAPAPLLIGEGWDNTIWDIGSLPDGTALALRVARREIAVELLAHETLVLRHLAPRREEFAMRIPAVLATADAAMLGAWVFGHAAVEARPSDQERCADALVRTLAALHGPAPGDLPRNAVRGCPLANRDRSTRRDLDAAPLAHGITARALQVWEDGLAAPVWEGPDLLLHGDPHPANVVVADDGAPVLIDFGDTTPGDPATDLGALALHRPDALADDGDLLAIYRAEARWDGIQDPRVWDALVRRARAWSMSMAAAILTAHRPDDGLGRCASRLLAEV